jgi:hypothetical protein
MKLSYVEISPSKQQEFDKIIEQENAGNTIIIGLKVISPEAANKLKLNIRPQHIKGEPSTSTILEVFKNTLELKNKLQDKHVTIVTERPNVDAVGAGALIKLITDKSDKLNDQELIDRVQQINDFNNGIFNIIWPPKSIDEVLCSNTKISGIHKAMGDFNLPLSNKVEIMEEWLLTGKQPEKYVQAFNQDVSNLKSVPIKITEKGIAVIETDLPGAHLAGYTVSPVVIAINNKFMDPVSKQETVKYTICQYTGMECANLPDLTKALNELEGNTQGKWGGNPNLIGSPMGFGTKLKQEDIVAYTEGALIVDLINIIKDANKPTGISNTNVTDHTLEVQKGLTGVAK